MVAVKIQRRIQFSEPIGMSVHTGRRKTENVPFIKMPGIIIQIRIGPFGELQHGPAALKTIRVQNRKTAGRTADLPAGIARFDRLRRRIMEISRQFPGIILSRVVEIRPVCADVGFILTSQDSPAYSPRLCSPPGDGGGDPFRGPLERIDRRRASGIRKFRIPAANGLRHGIKARYAHKGIRITRRHPI